MGDLPPAQVRFSKPLRLRSRGFIDVQGDAMARPEKVQAVQDIREGLEAAEAVFLTEYRGLTVQAVQDLRKAVRDSGAEYKVVKMTLARLAAADAGIEGLEEYLSGPTAIAFAKSDPVSTAKALKDFSRDHEVFVLKAGYLSGNILTPEEVSTLAEIEPREVLLARIAGGAKAPLFKAAGMFASFTRDAASMFSQLLDKKESGEFGGEPVDDAVLPDTEPEETTAVSAEEE
jgi:large subunit ribosomal protein L10